MPVLARGWCDAHYQRWYRHGDVNAPRRVKVTPVRRNNNRECEVADCDQPYYAIGQCRTHYSRLRNTGDVRADRPLKQRQEPDEPCSVPGCDNLHQTHGWCQAHFHRWYRYGDVLANVPIGKLPRGRNAAAEALRLRVVQR